MMVKCADRLHNLKTSQSIPQEKKLRKARETIGIYAPLRKCADFRGSAGTWRMPPLQFCAPREG